jgi:hypothetical protein
MYPRVATFSDTSIANGGHGTDQILTASSAGYSIQFLHATRQSTTTSAYTIYGLAL